MIINDLAQSDHFIFCSVEHSNADDSFSPLAVQ